LEEQLLQDAKRIVGSIHTEIARQIREVVQISPTIADRMRRIILESLPEE
jgi:hypothetical protein